MKGRRMRSRAVICGPPHAKGADRKMCCGVGQKGFHRGGLGTSACLVGHIVSQMLALYCANAVAAGDRTQAARLMWASFAIQVATVFVFFFMTCRWVYASIQAMAGTAVAPATRYRVFF